jgi:UDP-N-acetyl-D-mannosaminuronic acid dehydrogenase
MERHLKNIERIFTKKDVLTPELLKQMDDAPGYGMPGGILLVVNDAGKLLGTITDGDIRRAMIKNPSFALRAEEIMTADPITFPDDYTIQEILGHLSFELEKRNRKTTRFLGKIILTDDQNHPTRILDYYQLWEQRVATHRHLCVIGLGYVGLTLALVLADEGYQVTGVESDQSKIDQLKAGHSYIHEVGLPELLKEQSGVNFKAQRHIPEDADVFIVSVGTPVSVTETGQELIMNHLESAISGIGKILRPGHLVVLRSTVPVGTCRNFVKEKLEQMSGLRCGLDFHLSFAPERTAEGKALRELRALPQVIGGFNNDSLEATSAIFREITPTIIRVDSLESAEMVKLINNSFRDYIFAFANETAKLASHFNINIRDVIKAANEGYPRDRVPFPSPGVGGPCLTKDPYIFDHVANSFEMGTNLFKEGRRVNMSMHQHVVDSIISQVAILGKDLRKLKILVCGLSFKGNPETGDLRESSSIAIIRLLAKHCPVIYGHDPVASEDDISSYGIKPVGLPQGFLGMDIILFLNNHESFEKLDVFTFVRSMNERPIVYDAWNLFRSDDVLRARPAVYMGLSFFRSSIEE